MLQQKVKILSIIQLLLLPFLGFAQQPNCTVADHSTPVSFHTHVNGISINGEYSIWYKCLPGNNPATPDIYNIDNKITKAFIICEGFDPNDDNDLVDCYRHVDGDYFRQDDPKVFDKAHDVLPNENLMTELRKRGYDVICLNLLDNKSSIISNAALYRELILFVQGQLNANGSKHQITAGGWSMGGMVTRVALVEMERNNEDHRVDKYITFDSPHRGAHALRCFTSSRSI